MKLHLACGTVYLNGWVNVDAKGELASNRPDLVEENGTDLAHYFKTPYIKNILGHNKRGKIVVDVKANVMELPFLSNSIEQILNVNLIDHLRLQDLPKFIAECHRVLQPGGELITDVGDVVKSAKMLADATTTEELEWALRLIYCHSRDKYDSHHWGYTADYLRQVLKPYGFRYKWARTNYIEHVYPAFQLSMEKI